MMMQRRPESWVVSGCQWMTTDVCQTLICRKPSVTYTNYAFVGPDRRVDLECWNWHRTNGSTDESLVEAPVESELGKDY